MSGYGPGSKPVFTQAIEYDGSGNPIYVGSALQGSSKSAAAWRISKITYSGDNPIDIPYAEGSSGFAAIWDNRASLSYS